MARILSLMLVSSVLAVTFAAPYYESLESELDTREPGVKMARVQNAVYKVANVAQKVANAASTVHSVIAPNQYRQYRRDSQDVDTRDFEGTDSELEARGTEDDSLEARELNEMEEDYVREDEDEDLLGREWDSEYDDLD